MFTLSCGKKRILQREERIHVNKKKDLKAPESKKKMVNVLPRRFRLQKPCFNVACVGLQDLPVGAAGV